MGEESLARALEITARLIVHKCRKHVKKYRDLDFLANEAAIKIGEENKAAKLRREISN